MIRRLVAALLILSAPTWAQEFKTIRNPALEGGEVIVRDLVAYRYVGNARVDSWGERLSKTWHWQDSRGVVRLVICAEARLPGQDERSWREEHARLVAKTAAQFPPIQPPKVRG